MLLILILATTKLATGEPLISQARWLTMPVKWEQIIFKGVRKTSGLENKIVMQGVRVRLWQKQLGVSHAKSTRFLGQLSCTCSQVVLVSFCGPYVGYTSNETYPLFKHPVPHPVRALIHHLHCLADLPSFSRVSGSFAHTLGPLLPCSGGYTCGAAPDQSEKLARSSSATRVGFGSTLEAASRLLGSQCDCMDNPRSFFSCKRQGRFIPAVMMTVGAATALNDFKCFLRLSLTSPPRRPVTATLATNSGWLLKLRECLHISKKPQLPEHLTPTPLPNLHTEL